MISIQISDVKVFMNKLFLTEYFDAFFLSEANFVTFNTFHIDGTLQHTYYSSEEQEEYGMSQMKYSRWKMFAPGRLVSSIPTAMGRSRSGSKPRLMAR